MKQQIASFIEKYQLIDSNDGLLLAISGGVDSVVLGTILRQLGYKFALAHANFQLRGDDSDADQHFVEQLAQSWQVPFYTQRFDTQDFAKAQGISIQMAARSLRYHWFEQLLQEHGLDKIVLAHHRSDLVETILLNLAKGTGIKGLRGFLYQQKNLIRPLYNCTKREILQFAKDQGLSWREDASNQSDYYQRNLVRNQVIPLLEQINPNLEQTMAQNALYLREAELFLQAQLIEDPSSLNKATKHEVAKAELLEWPELKWWMFFSPLGFNTSQIQQIKTALRRQPGAMFYSGKWSVNIDRERLLIDKRWPQMGIRTLHHAHKHHWDDGCFQWELSTYAHDQYTMKADAAIGCWDLDKLTFPLTLRPWRKGDRFRPLGMQGTKKVSDFLIDRKVPRSQKEHVLVLTSKEEIAWVVGMQISESFKLDSSTTKVLEISRKSSTL